MLIGGEAGIRLIDMHDPWVCVDDSFWRTRRCTLVLRGAEAAGRDAAHGRG